LEKRKKKPFKGERRKEAEERANLPPENHMPSQASPPKGELKIRQGLKENPGRGNSNKPAKQRKEKTL